MGSKPSVVREPTFDPDAFDIRHVIDIGLAAKRETRPPRTSDRWAAGSLGYCPRRQFLERAGVPRIEKDDDGKRNRVFWLGDIVEESFLRQLTQSGLLIASQVHLVDEELQVSGYIDAIWGGIVPLGITDAEADYTPEWQAYLTEYRYRLKMLYDNRPFPITVTEIKSANQYSAERMFTEGPSQTHAFQAGCYGVMWDNLAAAGELPEGLSWLNIERIQIAVLAKGDLTMPVFDVLSSHKRRVLERLELLNEAWESRELPACECKGGPLFGGKEFKYCAYGDGETCCARSLIEQATSPAFWEEGGEEG